MPMAAALRRIVYKTALSWETGLRVYLRSTDYGAASARGERETRRPVNARAARPPGPAGQTL